MKAHRLAALITLALLSAPGFVLAHPAAPHATPQAAAVLSAEAGAAARAVDAFHAALANADQAAATNLLDERAMIFEEGEAEASRAAYVAGHLPADIAYLRGVRQTIVERTGTAQGGFAWIATRGRALGTFHDHPVDRETTETMVLRRTPQGWRIVHIHWSSHAAKPPAS
jgi:hypothetical protein